MAKAKKLPSGQYRTLVYSHTETVNGRSKRIYELRHYNASVSHALGIPDQYIMARGGWGNDAVLKSVYRHAMNDKTAQTNKAINSHFSDLCNTKCNTK